MSVPTITHNEATSRFELHLDANLIGFAEYFDDEDSGVREFHHTEVDPHVQGAGYAGRLVGHALKETGEAGLKVAPVCPYVAGFIRRHPRFQEFVTEG